MNPALPLHRLVESNHRPSAPQADVLSAELRRYAPSERFELPTCCFEGSCSNSTEL